MLILVYECERREGKCLELCVTGHAPECDQQHQTSGYVRAEREWRAGTTASSAKGGRPGTTAVVPGGSTKTPLAGVTMRLIF